MQQIQESQPSPIRAPETNKNTDARRNLYNLLSENRQTRIEPSMYLYLLVTAKNCGVIDEGIYATFSDMGISAKLPQSVMAGNLRDRLLDDLEKEFGKTGAGKNGEQANSAEEDDEKVISAQIHGMCEKAGE